MAPYKVKERERVDVLAGVKVAPERTYAPARVYAPARNYQPARNYAPARTYGDARVHQPGVRRYRTGAPRRYGVARPRVRHDILVLPPRRSGGGLLAMPSWMYEQAFESNSDSLWLLGDGLDFTEAAWSARSQEWEPYDPEDFMLKACPAASVQATFEVPDTWNYESPLWDEVPDLLAAVRAEILADPEVLTHSPFAAQDARAISITAGSVRVRSADEILAAIVDDPDTGLGAAAVDLGTWYKAALFGPDGVRLAELFDQIEEDEYVVTDPVENLLFDADGLHPRTDVAPWNPQVRLVYGDYAVTEITYHGNRGPLPVSGWRSVHLYPWGEAHKPTFTNDDPTKPGWVEL